MSAPHHSVFTGRMPFLPPNQQRQSTEGARYVNIEPKFKNTKQMKNEKQQAQLSPRDRAVKTDMHRRNGVRPTGRVSVRWEAFVKAGEAIMPHK